jgi:PBS lyase HEAT-like repeat
MSPLIVGWLTVMAADPGILDRPVSALTAIHRACVSTELAAVTDRFVRATHWRDRDAVGKELATFGESAAAATLAVLQSTDDQKLERDAFQWLRKYQPTHSLTKDFVLTEGLTSTNFSVRYESLWHVGEQHWAEARDQLFQQMQDYHGEAYFRFVAAKSLAELGDRRCLRTLIEAVQNDRYMPRHFGNLGLKAITGKSLSDFGYDYGEGAFVSGGNEARMLNPDPLETAETLARRHTACRDYLKWLHDEQPELYATMVTRF